MSWRWLSVCVSLFLLLAEHPKGAKGEPALTFQNATVNASTQRTETDEDYNTSVGYVMVLPCGDADESDHVTWRREGGLPLDTAVAGVEVRGGALWFLPADSSHSGVYECNRSDADLWHARLSVGRGVCPELNSDKYLKLHRFGRLKCGQDHIFRYDANLRITWLKDCIPLNRSEMVLEFPQVSIHDKGSYTCLLHFSLDGHNYTSASTTQVSIKVFKQLSLPKVILPANETRTVELGCRHELCCNVSAGNTYTSVYWTMTDSQISNDTYFTITEQKLESWVVKTLIISEVRLEHLNIPFRCWATNAVGHDFRQILLQAANREPFYFMVGLAVSCGLLVVCVCLCWRCRVELVLLYRSLCPLHKQHDDKLYDAYVSYPSGNGASVATTFALQVLPEVLESNYGYKLFIRGRDDLPGEAVFDAIDKALAKSRRLLIVLDGTQMDTHTQTHTHTHTPADMETVPITHVERTLGQYEALVNSGLKVVIVQTGEGDGASSLPPPLQLLTRSRRPLRWHTHTNTHTHADTHTHWPAQQRFWKELRYHMPAPRRTHSENSHTHTTAV